MLKIWGGTINRPSELILKQALIRSTYPSNWEKGNIVPVFKIGYKEKIRNYRPVSLLPICCKVFEMILFNMFSFFLENRLIAQKQSGLKPGDSCINQLLSITH